MLKVTIAKPASLKDLYKTLARTPGPRKFLAGGTDLCVSARHGAGVPCNWLDISDIPELQAVKISGKTIQLGSARRLHDLENSPLVQRWLPALHKAMPHFASPPLRQMATLGGNCANASPSADGVCALCAEGAKAVIRHPNGKQTLLPVEKLFTGPKKTILKQDELIVRFEIPKTGHRGSYQKLGARRALAISKIALAATAWLDGNIITDIRIFLGAVGPTVLRACKTEAALRGSALGSEKSLRQAAELIASECSPIDDQRSTARYRRAMSPVLLERALAELREERL
ncbi:MAG TPA: xanthine dehydrogenase family protein subunit M [Elusimicrobiales bacterium]|nr:xanthine dehydrogenase family protein subunit M [Elusimicrobiales bacterium]